MRLNHQQSFVVLGWPFYDPVNKASLLLPFYSDTMATTFRTQV